MSYTFKPAAAPIAVLLGAGLLLTATSAQANNPLSAGWDATYPGSLSHDNAGCALCHGDGSLFPLNPYGLDLQSAWESLCGGDVENCTTDDIAQGFLNVESLDSDAPGDLTQSSNLVEIMADTQPGWAESDEPGKVDGPFDPEPEGCIPFVDPTVIDFGNVPLGGSALETAFVTNNGNADCLIDVEVSSASGEFALVSGASLTVAPTEAAAVDVSYAPIDLGDDIGQLVLTLPDSAVNVELLGRSEADEPAVDMDIGSFRVTGKVSLGKRAAIIDVQLAVVNGGDTDGLAYATITGVQEGNPVYAQTLPVSDPAGGGSTRYTFQSYIAEEKGTISWTAVITDDDPDVDVDTAITVVK